MDRWTRPSPLVSLAGLSLLALVELGGSSCAYYNTFYLARRYYTTATEGSPYALEKPTGAHAGNYQKSIDYSKKLLANYTKSKWVDDAYLLWAKALLGKEDPLQAVNMLLDFPARFPNSSLKDEATFYLGVAYRQARKHREALVPLDEFLEKAPKHELVPYAHLERGRALMSLGRPAEAARASGEVIERFPASPLVVRVRATRAEARLAGGDPHGAREDFRSLGLRAVDDAERFTFLLREAECLEAARDFPAEIALLEGALAHEPAPVKSANAGAPTGPGADRYGQLTLRIGTCHLLAGRSEQALAAYRNVIQDYPKTPLAAEAQYRIGYAYETVLDSFTVARQEYAKVRDQSVSSAFFAQATQRQQSLDRLSGYRSAGADSLDRKVEAGFLLAEQYLFQLDKPERALEAYAGIAREHAGTPAAAKALNAEAWVLRRKLERPAEADSLLWVVVRQYPATEAQLAARDYLESAGHTVPTELIKMPERKVARVDTTLRLTQPPEGRMPLGAPLAAPAATPIAPARPDTLAPPAADRDGDIPRAAPGAATNPERSPPPPAGAPPPPRPASPLDDPPRPRPDSTATAPPDTSRKDR